MLVCRIAEKEKQWEVKMKETLARKEQRIRALHNERDRMIAEVSKREQQATHSCQTRKHAFHFYSPGVVQRSHVAQAATLLRRRCCCV